MSSNSTTLRSNVVRALPSRKDADILVLMADRVSALYNEGNYIQRQRFIDPEKKLLAWSDLEKQLRNQSSVYKALPSDVAQETIKKLSEAWKSYQALRKRWKAGALKDKPGLPRYKKDKKTQARTKDYIPVKTSRSYTATTNAFAITLPRDVKSQLGYTANQRLLLPVRGSWRYRGRQKRVELQFSSGMNRWYIRQAVGIQRQSRQERKERWAGIDLGVRVLASVSVEGMDQSTHYGSRDVLKDFDYWGRQIARHQRALMKSRKKKYSKRLSRYHRMRWQRWQTAMEAMAKAIASDLRVNGVTHVAIGHPKNILRETSYNRKWAGRIHHFWSFRKVANILLRHLERKGIQGELVPERGTSSTCPFCQSRNVVRYPRNTLRCKDSGHKLHSDQAGSRNMIRLKKPDISWDALEASAAPEAKRWNSHCWVDVQKPLEILASAA